MGGTGADIYKLRTATVDDGVGRIVALILFVDVDVDVDVDVGRMMGFVWICRSAGAVTAVG